MQRIINNPNDVVDEMINGFIKAHKDIIEKTENNRVLKYKKAPILI
jgi:dihydroxyacetone kinase-like protein